MKAANVCWADDKIHCLSLLINNPVHLVLLWKKIANKYILIIYVVSKRKELQQVLKLDGFLPEANWRLIWTLYTYSKAVDNIMNMICSVLASFKKWQGTLV